MNTVLKWGIWYLGLALTRCDIICRLVVTYIALSSQRLIPNDYRRYGVIQIKAKIYCTISKAKVKQR